MRHLSPQMWYLTRSPAEMLSKPAGRFSRLSIDSILLPRFVTSACFVVDRFYTKRLIWGEWKSCGTDPPVMHLLWVLLKSLRNFVERYECRQCIWLDGNWREMYDNVFEDEVNTLPSWMMLHCQRWRFHEIKSCLIMKMKLDKRLLTEERKDLFDQIRASQREGVLQMQ